MASIPNSALSMTDQATMVDTLFAKTKGKIAKVKLQNYVPIIAEIQRLKRERNAVILAHNYQTPEIFYGVADIVGDSLQLAVAASKTDADVIVQGGVYFMAETSKILNPNKKVLIPSMEAGCSLAASITGADVRLLRQKYPGVPIVTYVNTSADVKAESDVCCTSSNAVKIVELMAKESGSDSVLCIPDEYLAKYIASKTNVKILTWQGHCEVHERFTGLEIRQYRQMHPGVVVLAHPECPPDVIAESDFTGSTSAMIDYVGKQHPKKVIMITECSMSDNVAIAYPDVEFIRPCNLCPHMKEITLENILHSLQTMQHEVVVDAAVADRAKQAVERMIALSAQKQ
jgi:quinolinate synthase